MAWPGGSEERWRSIDGQGPQNDGNLCALLGIWDIILLRKFLDSSWFAIEFIIRHITTELWNYVESSKPLAADNLEAIDYNYWYIGIKLICLGTKGQDVSAQFMPPTSFSNRHSRSFSILANDSEPSISKPLTMKRPKIHHWFTMCHYQFV